MCKSAMKTSCLWTNISEVAVQNFNFAHSVYQCAHFSGNDYAFPRNPEPYGGSLTGFDKQSF